jgi:hypothetical protein
MTRAERVPNADEKPTMHRVVRHRTGDWRMLCSQHLPSHPDVPTLARMVFR